MLSAQFFCEGISVNTVIKTSPEQEKQTEEHEGEEVV